MCKIIHKITLNVSSQKLDPMTLSEKSSLETSKVISDAKNNQILNKLKDLIKQNLVILESWPMPLCSEYYNQVCLFLSISFISLNGRTRIHTR